MLETTQAHEAGAAPPPGWRKQEKVAARSNKLACWAVEAGAPARMGLICSLVLPLLLLCWEAGDSWSFTGKEVGGPGVHPGRVLGVSLAQAAVGSLQLTTGNREVCFLLIMSMQVAVCDTTGSQCLSLFTWPCK